MPTYRSCRFPRPLRLVLEQDSHFSDWLARYRYETSLSQLVLKGLPRLVASQTRVMTTYSGQLRLVVPSGSVATLLKQRTPELLNNLAANGYEFNAISVMVQPSRQRKFVEDTPAERRLPPDKTPLARLIKELPDCPLKSALVRFLKRC